MVCDFRKHGQETLRMAHRFESSHSPFAFPRRLMGVFGAVVEPPVFPVPYSRHHFAPGGHIALQLIGDDRAWYILQTLQQLSEEALRGFGPAGGGQTACSLSLTLEPVAHRNEWFTKFEACTPGVAKSSFDDKNPPTPC